MKCKIAVVQFEIAQCNPEANIKKAEEYIKNASSQGANIIVFPEDFVTGPIEGKKELYDNGEIVKKFQRLAKKYSIDIVPGSFIESTKTGNYNTTYYIDSEGEIKLRYRKINLWHPERPYFAQGNQIAVCNTKYGKIGLVICWDLIFPELFRRMVRRGVDIVICPSYWCYGDAGRGVKHDPNAEINLVDATCAARAFENEIIMVYCNAAGKMDLGKYKDTLIGHSQITVPFKGAIKKLDHNHEEMFVQEIDTDILKDAERAYKIRDDLRKRVL